ncbi:MAG: hypothetical protein COB15_06505 [Flavobacteriales bacterium]|nr:MAG: hypothetical protein COB15_06505 [Flavobacteriales bacterium]
MKKITQLLLLLNLLLSTCLSVSAQAPDNSLQASLNESLKNSTPTLSAHANLQQDAVQLTWKHNKENSSKKYIIEKRTNHKDWEEITTVVCATQKTIDMQYFHLDHAPSIHPSYYRLKMIDANGKNDYSNVIRVYYNKYKAKTPGISIAFGAPE